MEKKVKISTTKKKKNIIKSNSSRAILLLADGTYYEGISVGTSGEVYGEIICDTSEVGYQEIITNPSSKGKIICFTFTEIGNYGVNKNDEESDRIHATGIIAKQISKVTSNWQAQKGFIEYLKENNTLAIENLDTRALFKHIRKHGEMMAVLSTVDFNFNSLKKKLNFFINNFNDNFSEIVSTKKEYEWTDKLNLLNVFEKEKLYSKITDNKKKFKVIAIDCGIKKSFLQMFASSNCVVNVVPIKTKAERILEYNPDGVFISNGPSNYENLIYLIEEIKKLLGKKPILGIELGHLILALALDLKVYKMKSGHHGTNHSVKNIENNSVEVVCQNHSYVVDPKSLKDSKYNINISHINLNDQTIEGIDCPQLKSFSVQYYPLARPGAHDAPFVFNKFINYMKTFKEEK